MILQQGIKMDKALEIVYSTGSTLLAIFVVKLADIQLEIQIILSGLAVLGALWYNIERALTKRKERQIMRGKEKKEDDGE